MRYMRRTAYMVIVTILCAACMLSSDRASAQDETAGASAVPSAALEISGHWRDTSDDSEWRFVLRDPTGELLGTGSADSGGDEFADGENGDNQPAGSALLTPRSLLVDVSRPRRAGGPDTAVLELRETAVAESLGLNQGLLSLTDLISLSASSRKDVNLALGFERALPPSLRLGKKWAHFLTLSSQYQFRNPEEGKTDASLMYAARAYWGRGWAWKAVSREGPALDSKVQAAIEAARARAEMSEQSPLIRNPGLIAAVLQSARNVWRPGSAPRTTGLEMVVASYANLEKDASKFLNDLKQQNGPVLREGDFRARLRTAFERYMIDERAWGGRSPDESYEQALKQAKSLYQGKLARNLADESANVDERSSLATLAVVVDAVDPTVLTAYYGLFAGDPPAGDLSQQLRGLMRTAFRAYQDWSATSGAELPDHILNHVRRNTIVYEPRWILAVDASYHSNSGLEIPTAPLLDARLSWRPDPAQPYGLTLSHKRGREESNRDRRVRWTSLEFSYRF